MTVVTGKLSEYTIDDLLLMCIRNNVPVLFTTDEKIMRMRCIMALRGSGLIEERLTEHVISRNITFSVGSKHRVTGSQGFDFATGIIEVVSVGEVNDALLQSADYEDMLESDPSLANAVWIAYKYVHPKSILDDYSGIMYFPAELLADHIACR